MLKFLFLLLWFVFPASGSGLFRSLSNWFSGASHEEQPKNSVGEEEAPTSSESSLLRKESRSKVAWPRGDDRMEKSSSSIVDVDIDGDFGGTAQTTGLPDSLQDRTSTAVASSWSPAGNHIDMERENTLRAARVDAVGAGSEDRSKNPSSVVELDDSSAAPDGALNSQRSIQDGQISLDVSLDGSPSVLSRSDDVGAGEYGRRERPGSLATRRGDAGVLAEDLDHDEDPRQDLDADGGEHVYYSGHASPWISDLPFPDDAEFSARPSTSTKAASDELIDDTTTWSSQQRTGAPSSASYDHGGPHITTQNPPGAAPSTIQTRAVNINHPSDEDQGNADHPDTMSIQPPTQGELRTLKVPPRDYKTYHEVAKLKELDQIVKGPKAEAKFRADLLRLLTPEKVDKALQVAGKLISDTQKLSGQLLGDMVKLVAQVDKLWMAVSGRRQYVCE